MTAGPTGELSCPACQAVLAGSPRFCPECGTPLAQAPVRETRRTVTLLFTDVTGSTAMGEALDPEAYRGVMGRYFEVARQAVERHGGTLEKFVGDAVLAVFGMPEVREDDAVRAVRAADDLRSAMADLSTELEHSHGVRLAIRTGVNTGPVVTGSARAGGAFATGDAVNTAARLEQAAGPGEVLLGAATYDLVRDAVEVESVEPVVAKGKAEPVPAYRIVSVQHAAPGRARHFDAPLVGRARERRALDDALDGVLSHRRCHLVTVIGAPGMGKTRLISDFVGTIGDRATIAGGRCVSYGHGITFWPIVQAIRSAVGVGGTESDEVTRKALLDAMGDATDGADVAGLLLPLLGGAGAPGSQDQTFWAVRRMFEQLAQRAPLVIVIDDLHWAEQTLLDLLDDVREELADLPVLLVCQARPELFDEHPDWGRGSLNALTFQLEPFGPEEVRSWLEALLGSEPPEEVVTRIADWSGGNPLFTEEMVAHLREVGRLHQGPDGWIADDLAAVQMPPTVSALLAARLDRLPPTDRDLLERISVIGLELTAKEAAHLADPGTDAAGGLASLVRHDLLTRVRSAEGDTWAFRHILIRDAAYEALPKALRADLHVRFADALESERTDAGAEQMAFAAHHLEQASRLRHELTPQDPALLDLDRRTALTLAAAADAARELDEMDSFRTLLRRAIRMPIDNALRRELIMRDGGGFFGDTVPVAEQRAGLRLFEEALDDTATDLDHAYLASARMQLLFQTSDPTVDVVEAERKATRFLELAEQAGQGRAAIEARKALAMVGAMRSRWRDVIEHTEHVVRSQRANDTRGAFLAFGAAYLHGPDPFSRTIAFTDEMLAVPGISRRRRANLLLSRSVALAGRDDARWREVLAESDELFATLARGQDAFTDSVRGEVYRFAGDLTATIGCFERMAARVRAAGQDSFAGTYEGFTACLMIERGDPIEAVLPLLEAAEQHAESYDVTSMTVINAARAVVNSRQGDHDRALEHARLALEYAHTSDSLRDRADARRLMAEVWARAGDTAEQRRQLELALAEYREKEAVVLARVTERMLAGLDSA